MFSVDNKNKIAIVVVGYNRLRSIKRLLVSLEEASYPSTDIPLVISIDSSGDETLYSFVEQFVWSHGQKYVIIHNERLGLIKHIYFCGGLTDYFKAIVLLEDDLFVSPYFYYYVVEAVNKYGDDDNIAEISLYKNETNGFVGLPISTIHDGNDVILMQDVSTWGQCWTKNMWKGFVKWRDNHTDDYIETVDIPNEIKKWDRAWSKYYNAYVVDCKKFVLYPNISLTTNFSDAGEHGNDNNSVVQVNLLQGEKEYKLKDSNDLVKYDIYGNNLQIPEWLGVNSKDVCLDLYGFHNFRDERFILSTNIYPFKVVRSFALNMRPIELNIKYNIKGEGIYLYEREKVNDRKRRNYSDSVVFYYLQGFNHFILFKYIKRWFMFQLKRKIKACFRC